MEQVRRRIRLRDVVAARGGRFCINPRCGRVLFVGGHAKGPRAWVRSAILNYVLTVFVVAASAVRVRGKDVRRVRRRRARAAPVQSPARVEPNALIAGGEQRICKCHQALSELAVRRAY